MFCASVACLTRVRHWPCTCDPRFPAHVCCFCTAEPAQLPRPYYAFLSPLALRQGGGLCTTEPALLCHLRARCSATCMRAAQESSASYRCLREGHIPFRRAFALQASGRNCSPAPDLVIWKLSSPRVFLLRRSIFLTDTGTTMVRFTWDSELCGSSGALAAAPSAAAHFSPSGPCG